MRGFEAVFKVLTASIAKITSVEVVINAFTPNNFLSYSIDLEVVNNFLWL